MKPSQFEYLAPTSLDDALRDLAEHDGRTRLLAGGQSLVPMLNLRRARPEFLLDLNRIPELSYIKERDGGVAVGAMTRQRELELSALVRERMPLLGEAVGYIASFQIRNRGTVGGSIALAAPGAELPAVLCAIDGHVTVQSLSEGERTIPADELFRDRWTTSIRSDEIITEVFFPGSPERGGWAFQEFSRRHNDLAIGGAAVILTIEEPRITGVAIALLGAGATPTRAARAEQALIGSSLGEEIGPIVEETIANDADPVGDVHGTAEYRSHLLGVMARRAVLEAVEVARG